MLREFEPRIDPVERPLPPDRKRNRAGSKRRKKNGHPHPEFDLRTQTYKLFGVDVTQIPGLEENALPLFSEVGRDMSRWPTAGNFVSWLALCPDNDISGGKVLWRPFLCLYFGGCTPSLHAESGVYGIASDPTFYFGCSSYRSTPRHFSLTVLSGSRKKAVRYVRWCRIRARTRANSSRGLKGFVT